MKTSDFKKLIKESVREVFSEELRSIILESLSKGKTITESAPEIKPQQIRSNASAVFGNRLIKESIHQDFSEPEEYIPDYTPPRSANSVEGSLPPGEVSMNQIEKLMNGS